MSEELLTLGEAAKLAAVHRTTMSQWVRAGRLEAVTLPPRYRRAGVWRYVRRADVERLMREKQGAG